MADLRDGALVPVLADYQITNAEKELSIVYADRRRLPAKTRSFVDFSVNWFRVNAKHLTSIPPACRHMA
jgi:DNA-binding transcriptional LysR family regulator